MYTCVSAYKGQRSSIVALQEPFTLVFEIGSLTGLVVLVSLGWLASESQAVFCLFLQQRAVRCIALYAAFYMDDGD